MGFAGYVTVCMQLYCVSFYRLSLHVSAYMAIFKCVGYFNFHMPEDRTDKQQRKGKQTNTHTRSNKINEGKQHRMTQMKTCSV
jgi:hypothetical protein